VTGPVCRVCVTFGTARRRRPNRAQYLTLYITGEQTLTCGWHARQPLKAGAVSIPLECFAGLLWDDELSSAEVRNSLQAASSMRRVEPSVPKVQLPETARVLEVSGPVVITVTSEGVRLELAPEAESGSSAISA
jgi:hypothetical protein